MLGGAYLIAGRLLGLVCICIASGAPSDADIDSGCLVYLIGPNDQQAYKLNEIANIVGDPRFNPNLPSEVVFHGYKQNSTESAILLLIKSYRYCIQNFNVLIFDYGQFVAGDNYIAAAKIGVEQIAPRIAKYLNELFAKYPNLKRLFHLVCHSLGGHMCGVIGRNVTDLPRITALDPAGPGFFTTVSEVVPSLALPRLTPTDATFVDCIHSDAGVLGFSGVIGKIDFYPNHGQRIQPGCSTAQSCIVNDRCNHYKSVEFYAESVCSTDPNTFLAFPAKDWEAFTKGQSTGAPLVQMGLPCNGSSAGSYYLQTRDKPPYDKGVNGTCYVPEGVDKIVSDLVICVAKAALYSEYPQLYKSTS